MMLKPLLATLATVGALAAASPAAAQAAATDGVLIIYGNDRCPTDSSGNEIVVCTRRPEVERFRIPQEFRDPSTNPNNQSWAVRSRDVVEANSTGIGSCSPVGPGGQSGCNAQELNRWARERQQQRDRERNVPLPR